MKRITLIAIAIISLSAGTVNPPYLTYVADPHRQQIQMYWKDEHQQAFGQIGHLKAWLEQRKKKLVFAMNGGMYNKEQAPVGLYIENGKTYTPPDTGTGNGNFYMKPNGMFYITAGDTPVICTTGAFTNNGKTKYATQSGPMLLINGYIHPAFKAGSTNLNIRNGVGILPDNKVVFVLSKEPVNFYDFAGYFKSLGCKNALYLDGYVSRAYLPEQQWIQTDGDFGVIIGITE